MRRVWRVTVFVDHIGTYPVVIVGASDVVTACEQAKKWATDIYPNHTLLIQECVCIGDACAVVHV